MVEATQNIRFGANPGGVSVVKCDLQNQFFIGPSRTTAAIGTLPRAAALDDQAVVKSVRGPQNGGASRRRPPLATSIPATAAPAPT